MARSGDAASCCAGFSCSFWSSWFWAFMSVLQRRSEHQVLARADREDGGAVCLRDSRDADQRRFRNGAAREPQGLCRVSDLRADQRLSEEMVQGHRQPREKGDLLAEIDTPEVDQQLAQARADLATAQANVNSVRHHGDALSGPAQDAIPFPSRMWTTPTATLRPNKPWCNRPRPTSSGWKIWNHSSASTRRFRA